MNSNNDEQIFLNWYQTLNKSKDGFAAKGTIAGALVVLESLRSNFSLDLDAHTAPGGSQIAGASGAAVKKILARFGEERRFVSEGGRTNRGLRGEIRSLLNALRSANLEQMSSTERSRILDVGQGFLVERVRDVHARQRIKPVFNPANATSSFINALLTEARETGKDGPIAQHLVGAKLQLRYPEKAVSNESYSTADRQLNRAGDFQLGDTAFHVTVAPMPHLYDRCKENLESGLRVYLVVPSGKLEGVKQNAATIAEGRISVVSIEDFIAQNVDELSEFRTEVNRAQLRALLENYNERVAAAESDRSLLIEIPPNL